MFVEHYKMIIVHLFGGIVEINTCRENSKHEEQMK